MKLKKAIQKKIESEGLINKVLWELIYQIKILLNISNRLHAKKRINVYLKEHERIKVHLGCGNKLLDGFLNTDLFGKIPLNITKKLPFPDNSVDLIYSNHVVEHIYYKQFNRFLKESYRVLKPGGMQIIATPSIDKMVKSIYFDKKMKGILLEAYSDNNSKMDSALLINTIFHMRFMHKFIYNLESMKRLGEKYGFKKVYIVSNLEVPDKTIQESLRRIHENDQVWEGITDTFIFVK